VSESESAAEAWLSERPDSGDPRITMLRFDRRASHREALERVREWTRVHFRLPDGSAILVAEVACRLPGCPPLETVVVFWTDEATRHRFKVFKAVEQVVEDDLPYTWLKEALIDDGSGFECC
jgi:hypothetical protein